VADLSRELAVTLDVIRAAGKEILKRYESFEKIEDAPADISTDADRASQEIILQRLGKEFPGDALCGEEATPSLSSGAVDNTRLWIVDPIDGTRGFAKKNGEFSIMIGLADKGKVVLGAVLEPGIDRLTYAALGQGCFVSNKGDQPQRCQVTSTSSLADAVLSISRSQKAEGERRLLQGFGAAKAIQTYSAGIKLAQVARGETDIYLGDYLTLKDWDVCAGHILVLEAGGAISSVDGAPITYEGTGKSLKGRGILATNGKLHDACLEVLKSGKYRFD
jgi:3'(2'), 5'-bisphosphate nucleotidase